MIEYVEQLPKRYFSICRPHRVSLAKNRPQQLLRAAGLAAWKKQSSGSEPLEWIISSHHQRNQSHP
jgi:hypothetical protein